MYVCVRLVLCISPISAIFLLDFGTVPTMDSFYAFSFNIYLQSTIKYANVD